MKGKSKIHFYVHFTLSIFVPPFQVAQINYKTKHFLNTFNATWHGNFLNVEN